MATKNGKIGIYMRKLYKYLHTYIYLLSTVLWWTTSSEILNAWLLDEKVYELHNRNLYGIILQSIIKWTNLFGDEIMGMKLNWNRFYSCSYLFNYLISSINRWYVFHVIYRICRLGLLSPLLLCLTRQKPKMTKAPGIAIRH